MVLNLYRVEYLCVLIHSLHRVDIEAEIRLQVDELMREELKNLKMVTYTMYRPGSYMHMLIIILTTRCI